MNLKKTAFYGVFLALAVVFSYIEYLIPLPLPVGMKLGLANIVAVYILYKNGLLSAVVISLLRVGIVNLLFGGVTAFFFGAAGALVSLVIMYLLKKTRLFSPIAVSAVGGVVHNIMQILVAFLIMPSKGLWYYLIYLVPTGVLAGMLIGIISEIILKNKVLDSLTKRQ